MTKKFILFVGNNRVGKTTCCKILQDLILRGYKKDTVILAFADSIRDELIKYYGLPREMIFSKHIDKDTTMIRLGDLNYAPTVRSWWKKAGIITSTSDFEDQVISLRQLLIYHGTNIRRNSDPNYWAKAFDAQVKEYSDSEFILCDDARFKIDFDYFLDKDTIIFHLDNGHEPPEDTAQSSFKDWLLNNTDRVIPIKVPLPLLKFTADKIIRAEVLPIIPGLRDRYIAQERRYR